MRAGCSRGSLFAALSWRVLARTSKPSHQPPLTTTFPAEYLLPMPVSMWACAAASFGMYALLYRASHEASQVRGAALRPPASARCPAPAWVAEQQHHITLPLQQPVDRRPSRWQGSCVLPCHRAAVPPATVSRSCAPDPAYVSAPSCCGALPHRTPHTRHRTPPPATPQRYVPAYRRLSSGKQVDWNTRCAAAFAHPCRRPLLLRCTHLPRGGLSARARLAPR